MTIIYYFILFYFSLSLLSFSSTVKQHVRLNKKKKQFFLWFFVFIGILFWLARYQHISDVWYQWIDFCLNQMTEYNLSPWKKCNNYRSSSFLFHSTILSLHMCACWCCCFFFFFLLLSITSENDMYRYLVFHFFCVFTMFLSSFFICLQWLIYLYGYAPCVNFLHTQNCQSFSYVTTIRVRLFFFGIILNVEHTVRIKLIS